MTESDPVLDVPILVVDDRAENRTALRSLLEMPGYRIVEAPSGAEALRVLMDREVAVLLLDVVMPQMDGFEVARMIKERDRTASVPIIFLTAQPDDAFLSAKGWEVGAVDFLSKPLVPEAVQSKVAVFAQLYRQRKEIERQAKRIVDAERREGDMRMMQLELAGERRWRSLAEAVPAILWTANADGRIDYMNHRWFEHTGISAERAAGSFVSAIHPDDVEHCKNVWSSAREKGEPLETEVRLLRASDRTYRWHICRAVPQLGATGQIVSWLGTFVDIDDQKRAEATLRENIIERKRSQLERELLYREAVDAIRTRDEFVSVASHELRTPLSALKLQLDGLLHPSKKHADRPLTSEQARAKIESAARQVDRMTRLVSELLDVSKMTAGGLRLELEAADLTSVVHDVVTRLGDEALRVGSPVHVNAPAQLEGRWDRMRIEQVLINLLTNAFKYAGGKPIDVTIEERGELARLTVTDHGMGIAKDDLERIFRRYEQAQPSQKNGGLGLGLYIVRQIVGAHGGTIKVESELGKGSSFVVDLPRTPPAASATREEQKHPHA